LAKQVEVEIRAYAALGGSMDASERAPLRRDQPQGLMWVVVNPPQPTDQIFCNV